MEEIRIRHFDGVRLYLICVSEKLISAEAATYMDGFIETDQYIENECNAAVYDDLKKNILEFISSQNEVKDISVPSENAINEISENDDDDDDDDDDDCGFYVSGSDFFFENPPFEILDLIRGISSEIDDFINSMIDTI